MAASSSSSSKPPILPISTPLLPPHPSEPPNLYPYLAGITSGIRDSVYRSRPWSQVTDRSAFSTPGSLSDAASRLRRNYAYFRLNYLLLVSLIVAFSLFSHPGSLFLLLALVSAWTFLWILRPSDRPFVLLGRSYSDRETLGLLVIASVFIVFLTSVGSVLISAALVGVAVVCVHGSFRGTDDLFLEEQEQVAPGFLSFVGGTAKNAASIAPSVVAAARV